MNTPERSIKRLTRLFLLGFIGIALSLTYWSTWGAANLLVLPNNPRLVEAERAILRGGIYDRHDQLLAYSQVIGYSVSGQPITRRVYSDEAAVNVVGYYSLTYGTGGVESVEDAILRGEDILTSEQRLINNLLHRPQRGSDVRLTIDMALQKSIAGQLGNYRGAVVVMDVPSGAIRAMVSAPRYDPNRLDALYGPISLTNVLFALVGQPPPAPLLNRATQGLYQPGGSLQTIILGAMLTDQISLDQPTSNPTTPVNIDTLVLQCAGDGASHTLLYAYAQACPQPFVEAALDKPGPIRLQELLKGFGLLDAPSVDGIITNASISTPLSLLSTTEEIRSQASGQGNLTVTPLQMVLAISVIANQGNSTTPYLIDAIRRPDATIWERSAPSTSNHAVVTEEVAADIQRAMRRAVTDGAAHAANQPDLTIYGHASIAYTGRHADVWFIGFAQRPNGDSVAIAVVVEGTTDPSVAARIGGHALWQAVQ